ncbi:hypothetical protein C7974DRAFT_414572 [Boeremia exigua]|uniref:uncharacterized protein n=1 Tax=Boeremia exigua TaxID=749465 RepID=UPI001E8CE969|nr:uncharacterized protein C7974DRAFT_414572 [Boeremia exigua]KAH6621890.1 hypothetical protein C7974DRAFT_414572 [Boeremia exigua]
MSEMYSMIDDYLAWNGSSSDLEPLRPDSAGTMFVDFASNGEMEISYRSGLNKKLPTPPVPSKNPERTKSTPLRHDTSVKENVRPTAQRKEQRKVEQSKPLPTHPSVSSRHDSVMSSGANSERATTNQTHHLPRLSSQTSWHIRPPSRNRHPPQVHATQRPPSRLASPTPPQTASSTSSYGAYTVTQPCGLTMHFQPPTSRSSTPSQASPTPTPRRAYIRGHDPPTNYTYTYDGRTMHIHRSPTPSRPLSRTSEYFDIAAGSYDSPNVSQNPARAPSKTKSRAGPSGKPLPPLPRAPGCDDLPEPPRGDAARRRRVLGFVRKLLGRLDQMGVMGDLAQRRMGRPSPGSEVESWAKGGYVV